MILGLFYRGCTDDKRNHFFASDDGLKMLAKRKNWYGDGTFRVVPGLFYQLYSIHVQWKKSHKTVPAMYVLMSGKKKRDYVKIFEFIKVTLYLQLFLLQIYRNDARQQNLHAICLILSQLALKPFKKSFRLFMGLHVGSIFLKVFAVVLI